MCVACADRVKSEPLTLRILHFEHSTPKMWYVNLQHNEGIISGINNVRSKKKEKKKKKLGRLFALFFFLSVLTINV